MLKVCLRTSELSALGDLPRGVDNRRPAEGGQREELWTRTAGGVEDRVEYNGRRGQLQWLLKKGSIYIQNGIINTYGQLKMEGSSSINRVVLKGAFLN